MALPNPEVQRYADALLALAEAVDAVPQVAADIDRAVALVEEEERVRRFLRDPLVRGEGKREALEEIFAGHVHHALVEFLEGSCGAQVLLLTPPPTIANPALAKGYAIAVKRVGLRKRVPVADIYSAFMRAGEARSSDGARQDSPINGWEVFYRDTESDAPIYHLSPTTLGQRIIAIIVSRTLLCEPDSLTLHTTRHSG